MPGFAAGPTDEYELVAGLAGLTVGEARARAAGRNTLYLARVGAEPVAYGWSASGAAEIGGLLRFEVPEGERYLWDFVTLAGWRGRGIYPRLLQAVLREEREAARRWWIGHDAPNVASGRGILRAGFSQVGEVRTLRGGLALRPTGPLERARLGAALLGIPVLPVEGTSP